MNATPISNQPEWLTVEEAARVLRIGRTKAYALTREWRASGGRSGLPVADLGDVLRVPRRALEELVEATLPSQHAPTPPKATQPRRPSRQRTRSPHQLALLDLTDPAR